MNLLNDGYQEYKKNNPDFAKVVESDSEGKSQQEFDDNTKTAKEGKAVKQEKKLFKVTRIYGPIARAIIDVLEKDGSLSFTDVSNFGVSVLEVYSNVDLGTSEYWD